MGRQTRALLLPNTTPQCHQGGAIGYRTVQILDPGRWCYRAKHLCPRNAFVRRVSAKSPTPGHRGSRNAATSRNAGL
jgi:hypothetical protein